MKLKTKRRFTLSTICLFYVLNGIEYAVIFPTLWGYIRTYFNSPSYMLGLIIAGYSITGLVANPIIGYWADRTNNIRLILILTNLGEIFGSFLYFIGVSHWVLFAGRLVAGLGAGAAAAVVADITRSTLEEDRTPILSVVSAFRQLGLILGPALNLFLRNVHYVIGGKVIDKFNSPGLFMVFMWILMEVAFIFMYYDLTQLRYEELLEEKLKYSYIDATAGGDASGSLASGGRQRNPSSCFSFLSPSQPFYESNGSAVFEDQHLGDDHNLNTATQIVGFDNPSVSSSSAQIQAQMISSVSEEFRHKRRKAFSDELVSDLMIESAERFILSTESHNPPLGSRTTGPSSEHSNHPNFVGSGDSSAPHCSWKYESSGRTPTVDQDCLEVLSAPVLQDYIKEYFRDEVVVLLGVAFICTFCQTVLETAVTPLTKEMYNYGELENSLIYFACGLEIVFVFAVVHILSKKVSDRILLLGGLILMCCALSWWLFYVPKAKKGDKSTLAIFFIGVFIDVLALPVLFVCATSLISKVTSIKMQAFTQGLRVCMVNIGCTLGPLWAGAYFQWRLAMFAVPAAICCLITVMYLISFPRLKVKSQPQAEDQFSESCEDIPEKKAQLIPLLKHYK